MAVQQIIVYRNPAEAAVWEAIGNGSFPNLFPIIVGLVVFFCAFIVLNNVDRKIGIPIRDRDFKSWFILGVSGLVSCAVMYYMWVR